ncbi:hypothetical protein [Clostridium taeniosporum]|uniref:Uncharacterized protein n=1 Tax=Clostridium taeniosporum TaxID=394958 RepID=A0A1D7XPJ5_9CLOT|nr:hypothetical protein [Clostridium taeniosporum]AOR25109.1 hypothetical protein BGI42_15310 [Clostridium taeniosporum]
MKKFDIKSIVTGLIIGVIGTSVVFVAVEKIKTNTKATTIPVVEEKKSEATNNNKAATIPTEEDTKSETITNDKIYFNENESNEETMDKIQKGMEIKADSSNNETDAEAIETMKKTGNWSYIEKHIPHMTTNGIEKVIEIYNSKHINPSEHKKASDYINK